MSKKDRQAKTSEQTKNEQIAIILAELENDIEHFKITVKKNDDQLNKFAKIINATKTEYQKLRKENAELKKYILNKKNMISNNNNNNNNNCNINNVSTINNMKL